MFRFGIRCGWKSAPAKENPHLPYDFVQMFNADNPSVMPTVSKLTVIICPMRRRIYSGFSVRHVCTTFLSATSFWVQMYRIQCHGRFVPRNVEVYIAVMPRAALNMRHILIQLREGVLPYSEFRSMIMPGSRVKIYEY